MDGVDTLSHFQVSFDSVYLLRSSKTLLILSLLSLPQLYIFSVHKGPFVEEFYQCVTYGSYTAQWQEQLYSILSLLLMFVIPLVVLIVTYSSAINKLRRESMRGNIDCFVIRRLRQKKYSH